MSYRRTLPLIQLPILVVSKPLLLGSGLIRPAGYDSEYGVPTNPSVFVRRARLAVTTAIQKATLHQVLFSALEAAILPNSVFSMMSPLKASHSLLLWQSTIRIQYLAGYDCFTANSVPIY